MRRRGGGTQGECQDTQKYFFVRQTETKSRTTENVCASIDLVVHLKDVVQHRNIKLYSSGFEKEFQKDSRNKRCVLGVEEVQAWREY